MGIKSFFENVGYSIKQHSPEILVVSGIIGVVASTVWACKATSKAQDILEEHKTQRDLIKSTLEETEDYTEEDAKKDTTIVCVQTGFKLAKVYAPCVILGGFSIAAILQSHNILRKRNIALTAAYTTLDRGFKAYKKRVADKFGADAERQLRFNTVEKEVEETVVDEKGKEKTTKKKIKTVGSISEGTEYRKFITVGHSYWDADEGIVISQLNMVQSYVNDKLKAKRSKMMTLNEVYEELDFEETTAGMVVGWVFDLKEPTGDNYIQFDVEVVYIPDEYGEYQKAYAIDFNVDGNIYKIREERKKEGRNR